MKPIIAIISALVIAGGVVGAAKTGVIKIPGLSPKPKSMPITKEKPKEAIKRPAKVAQHLPEPEEKPKFTVDSEKGAAAVADVWNGVDTGRLVQIVKDWNDIELARVVANMDGSKASELLSALPADRASRVSLQLQDMASQVPVEN